MPIFDRAEEASFFAKYFSQFISNGVFPNPSTNMQVFVNGGMKVTVDIGVCYINGYMGWVETPETLELAQSDERGRIDRIVARLDFKDRSIKLFVKKGVAGGNPTAPNLQRDYDMYEIGLADIKVNSNTIEILQENISDLRLNAELCGIVANQLQHVDTTTLFNQYQDWLTRVTREAEDDIEKKKEDFEKWYEKFKQVNLEDFNIWFENFKKINGTNFNDWFGTVKEVLDGDVAGNLLNKINEKVDKKALDIKYDTFSGALANIRNSSEAYMKSFYLEGVIEQETREGYNKFSLGKLKRSYGGTSTTGDDVIECEYNYSELKFDGILSYLPGQEFINKSIGVFKAGIYTFSSQLVSGTVTAKEGFDLDFEYGIKDSQGNNILTLSDFKNEKDVQNFTLNNDTELSFYLISNNSIVFDRTSIQLQITEGTEEKEYQSYGTMPSREFQAEVYGLGDSYNMLNIKEMLEVRSEGISKIYKENKIILNGTMSADWTKITKNSVPFELKAGETYEFRRRGLSNFGITLRILLGETIHKTIYLHKDIYEDRIFFTPSENTDRIYIFCDTGGVSKLELNNESLELQISKTIISKKIMPYGVTVVKINDEDKSKEQNYFLNFGNVRLYKDEIPYIEDDKVYCDKKWNKYVFNGNEVLERFSNDNNSWITYKCNTEIPIPIQPDTMDDVEEIFSNIGLQQTVNSILEGDKGVAYRTAQNSGGAGFYISLDGCETIQDYQNALKGNYIVYKLETPAKTEITGELANQIKNLYKNIHTYEDVTNIELLGYGEMNGEYLINTEFINKVSEINDIANIGMSNNIITLSVSNWVENINTGLYEYTITDSNVTASHFVQGNMDLENQAKMTDGYIESFDGGYKIISSEKPKSDVTMTIITQKVGA